MSIHSVFLFCLDKNSRYPCMHVSIYEKVYAVIGP